MPNRYIRESAIESEAVNSLSWQAEVFWRRLLNRADDFGRFTANTALLRASIFPLQLDRVSEDDVHRLLAECEVAGLLFIYSSSGKPFIILNKWEKGRAKESKYPQPDDDTIKRMQTYAYRCSHMSPTPTPTPTPTPNTDYVGQNDPAAVAATTSEELILSGLVASNDTFPAQAKEGATAGKETAKDAKPEKMNDAEWLASLCSDPAYTGIDVTREHAKFIRWCSVNSKQPGRRRFVNWLNRCDKPMTVDASGARQRSEQLAANHNYEY